MINIQKLFPLFFIFFVGTVYAQQGSEKNPLLVHSNMPIQFTAVTAGLIRDAAAAAVENADDRIKKISTIDAGNQTLSNTLLAADELLYHITDLQCKLAVIAATYADDSIRNTATEQNDKLAFYARKILLNEPLYKALKQYQSRTTALSLTAPQQKFLKETIHSFEKNGMKLTAEERKELENINKKIIDLGSLFDKNIAESKDSIQFTEAALKGLPAETMAGWKRGEGNYVVYVNGPNSIQIGQYAESDETRHIVFRHYLNRAYPKNIPVLDSLLNYRLILAKKLGFKSYAEYMMADKMAATTTAVWNFENDLVTKLTPHVTQELAVLKALKHQLHPEEKDTLFAWDIAYYNKKLLDTKYKLNTDELKAYFEMNNTITGMFGVYETLFGIQIKETHDLPVWNSKVKTFDILKDGKKSGSFYFDLYPRQNKYTHFACFPISPYRAAGDSEVLPVSALICNFPEGTATTPSLLTHRDVITLFHEFGHLVHSMLGRADIFSQWPFGVKGDFVEAPSQFLENWCWEYASLKTFAKHYKTGQVLPKEMFDKMKQAQTLNSGIFEMRQLYLGLLDLTFEDKYETVSDKGIEQTSKDLYAILQVPYPEGVNMISSFGHLNGYGANYYGYMWSKVFAQDMFSAFQKEGVMNTKTGLRYRTEILEKGSAKQEMDMLRSFLGRDPNSNAFLESLGIK